MRRNPRKCIRPAGAARLAPRHHTDQLAIGHQRTARVAHAHAVAAGTKRADHIFVHATRIDDIVSRPTVLIGQRQHVQHLQLGGRIARMRCLSPAAGARLHATANAGRCANADRSDACGPDDGGGRAQHRDVIRQQQTVPVRMVDDALDGVRCAAGLAMVCAQHRTDGRRGEAVGAVGGRHDPARVHDAAAAEVEIDGGVAQRCLVRDLALGGRLAADNATGPAGIGGAVQVGGGQRVRRDQGDAERGQHQRNEHGV